MAVFLTDDEINQFKANGIDENAIQYTVDSYRQEGVSDEEIRAKIDTKLKSFNAPVVQPEINKPKVVEQTPVEPAKVEEPVKTPVLEGGVEKKYTENLDSKGRVYYTDEQGNRVDFDVNPVEKIGNRLKAIGSNVKDWFEETNPESEAYKQKANTILALETLPFGLGKTATQAIASKLTPALGRSVASATAEGLGAGLVGSGTYGFGEGLIDDKNPLLSGLQGALLGGLTGGALSGVTSRVARGLKAGKLSKQRVKADKTIPQSNEVIEDAKSNYTGIIGRELPTIQTQPIDMPENIYNENIAKQLQKNIKSDITNLKVPKTNKTAITMAKQGRFWRKNIDDPLTRDIQIADEELNNIIGKINKNPDIINDSAKLEEFENRLSQKVQFPDDDLNLSYYDKYYQAINKATEYNQVGKDLQATQELIKQGEIKKSQLAQNADLPLELRQSVNENPPMYQVLHNEDLMNIASDNIAKDAEGVKNKLFNTKESMTAQEFEEARQTISNLYNQGNIDEALRLTEHITQLATKAGQSVQALSLWSKTTPEGAIRQSQKLISDYNKNNKKKIPELNTEQAEQIKQLAENIQKATTDEERETATALLLKYQAELLPAKAMDKLKTLRNISLLLNAKTFGRNIAGNTILASLEQPTKALASGIDKVIGLKTGERTRTLPQTKEYLRGLWQGAKQGSKDVQLGINTRGDIGKRYDLPTRKSFEAPVLSQLEKGLNYSLQVPDRAFYEATFNESLANQMKIAGVQEPTEDMINNATQDALESVYQNEGTLSNVVLGLRRTLNKAGGLGDWLIPYAQTPANVVQMGINYSPLGLVKGGVSLAQGNQRQASLDLARGLVGSGMYGLGLLGANTGAITKPQDDYQIRKNYETIGVRPNQINIGDTGYSYSQLQPISAGLSGGVALSDTSSGDIAKIADKSLSTVADLSMLRSLNNFYDDLSRSGIGTAIANAYTGVPSQFVPTLLNQVNAYVDPYQRETYSPNSLQYGLNQTISKIPFASKSLPYKYDVKGEKVKKYESEGGWKLYDVALNPIFANKKKDDVVMNEVTGLYERTGDKGGLLPVAPRTVEFKGLNGEVTKKRLTGKEYSEYQRQLGQVNYKLMKKFINTKFYQNLSDDDKLKLLGNIKRTTKTVVDERMFGKPDSKKTRLIKQLLKTNKQKATEEILREVNSLLPTIAEKVYNDI